MKTAKVSDYGTWAGTLTRADKVTDRLGEVCGKLSDVGWQGEREHWDKVIGLLDEGLACLGELSGLMTLAKAGARRYRALDWGDSGR